MGIGAMHMLPASSQARSTAETRGTSAGLGQRLAIGTCKGLLGVYLSPTGVPPI